MPTPTMDMIATTSSRSTSGSNMPPIRAADSSADRLERLCLANRWTSASCLPYAWISGALPRLSSATVLIEPVSGTPAYPLKTAADALAVIDRVHRAGPVGNLRLLLDLYHLVVNGDDATAVIERSGDSIGHVQIADAPGRNEPGTGEIDFAHYFRALSRTGYRGHIGLEYKPSGASAASFDWINELNGGNA